VLAAVRVAREQHEARGGAEHEHHADHRLLHVGPDALGESEQQAAHERGAERGDLHGGPLVLEAEAVREQHAATRDLRDGEVDEDDAAREHLHAERNVRRGDEKARGERGDEDRQVERGEAHDAPFKRRWMVSSKSPKRSFASGVPPTVNASVTTLIFARCASHCEDWSPW